jgi:hypothetical protein
MSDSDIKSQRVRLMGQPPRVRSTDCTIRPKNIDMKSTAHNFIQSIALVFALACSGIELHAQRGTITGVIADQSGAVIPDIQVTLSGPAGLGQTSTSDGQGQYSFQGLPTGEYHLQIVPKDSRPTRPLGYRLR